MDDFEKLEQNAYIYLLFTNICALVPGILIWIYGSSKGVSPKTTFAVAIICIVVSLIITTRVASGFILRPLQMLWQAIVHVSSDTTNLPPPNIDSLRLGRTLILSLANRVYQLSGQHTNTEIDHGNISQQASDIVKLFPQPIFAFDKDQNITNVSTSTYSYLNLPEGSLIGAKLFDKLNLEFSTDNTLEQWITDCQDNKVTGQALWQRVRVKLADDQPTKQCDIVACYNRDNTNGNEFIISLYDNSEEYNKDDQALSFVALAVHELRTPLTMLRGYVEVFEEELEGKLTPELTGYLHKLRLATDQLTAFVANVLNVVRVDENQLSFKLSERDWKTTLTNGSASMLARAQILGKTITFNIAENLPSVAVDPVSISEVVNNLLDNAIKYSGASKDIVITSTLNQEGFVETTVQDSGVGIPENVVPNLFEKFYRNHRTRNQFGGTGLGLYLSKAIVNAHGGNIWVKSKVGEGSQFSFTLLPYASLAEELKNSDNDGITRHAHGWIKNHSMFRR